MERSKAVPLTRGLIAGDTDPIYGQIEISLIDDQSVEISIQRQPYSGQPDIKFLIPQTSLQNLLDALHEAREKLDAAWLSRVAKQEAQTQSDAEEVQTEAQ